MQIKIRVLNSFIYNIKLDASYVDGVVTYRAILEDGMISYFNYITPYVSETMEGAIKLIASEIERAIKQTAMDAD